MKERKEKTSRYWGVSKNSALTGDKASIRYREKNPWESTIDVGGGRRVRKRFPTEREAAIHADRINLEYKLGKPLNILKPKQ